LGSGFVIGLGSALEGATCRAGSFSPGSPTIGCPRTTLSCGTLTVPYRKRLFSLGFGILAWDLLLTLSRRRATRRKLLSALLLSCKDMAPAAIPTLGALA